jgi:hypothetical protein
MGMLAATVSAAGAQTRPAAASGTPDQALVREYCVSCHNEKMRRGNLVLSGLDATRPQLNAPVWEKVVRKLRAGMMPPVGSKRPDAGRVEAFAAAIEGAIDSAAAAQPHPGKRSLHRLNRTEYGNSIRDLLGFEIEPASLLPPDNMTYGFDNIADGLTISPTLMESYIRAADVISRLAIGDRGASPRVETYRVPQTFSQKEHVDGTPLGTRGGVAVQHSFPADGQYVFGMTFYHYSGKLFGALQEREQVEVAVDGERVALLDVNLKMTATDELRTPPISVRAGQRRVSAAFVRRTQGPVLDFIMPFEAALNNLAAEVPGVTGLLHLTTLGINGPHNVTGVSETPIRRRIFSCRPATVEEETPCARTILSGLATRAFRRPAVEADIDHLMTLFERARREGGFVAGVQMGLKGVLSDPAFVFRFERTPPGVAPGSIQPISDLELASRLSFFLWSSGPDAPLLEIAAKNGLRDPAALEQQVKRMLADDRAEALATNFASQWLHLGTCETGIRIPTSSRTATAT